MAARPFDFLRNALGFTGPVLSRGGERGGEKRREKRRVYINGDGDDRSAINRGVPARSPGLIVRCGFVLWWTGNGVKGRKPPPWDRDKHRGSGRANREGRKEGEPVSGF